MKRLLAVALLLAVTVPAVAEETDKWYNPRPTPADQEPDLELPLPCGGKMAFRPVDVPVAGGVLDDHATPLGDPSASRGYSDYQRNAFLSAPFVGAEHARRYYIAKYDVTRDQFALMAGGACPAPTLGGRVPKTNVSWIQAMDFATAWSSWLLAHARDKLPKHGDSYAYARLPTEVEWEYAARGGIKVTSEEFLGSTFPTPGGIQAYVWAGPLAGGKPAPIGSKKPNPLGLYDMLGNVEQMTLEPFRLNRVGRLNGMAGGIVTRGGDYTRSPSDLTTAMRGELPPFNPATNQPTVLSTLGFRLVLSSSVQTGNEADVQKLAAEFDRLSHERESVGEDPRKLVAELKTTTTDGTLLRGLDTLDATLASGARERGDAARDTLLAQLEAAAAMAQIVESRERYAEILEAMADAQEQSARTYQTVITGVVRQTANLDATAAAKWIHDQKLDVDRVFDLQSAPMWRQLAPGERAEAGAALDGYLRLLRQIANGPGRNDIAAQGDVLRQELLGRNQRRVLVFLPVALRDLSQLTSGQELDRAKVHDEIIAAGRH
jgi:hypothetical protein